MRMLLVLVLLWLGSQYAALLLESAGGRPDRETRTRFVEDVLRRWPIDSRNIARSLIAEHGLPTEVLEERLGWEPEGAAEIVVYRDPDVRRDTGPSFQTAATQRVAHAR